MVQIQFLEIPPWIVYGFLSSLECRVYTYRHQIWEEQSKTKNTQLNSEQCSLIIAHIKINITLQTSIAERILELFKLHNWSSQISGGQKLRTWKQKRVLKMLAATTYHQISSVINVSHTKWCCALGSFDHNIPNVILWLLNSGFPGFLPTLNIGALSWRQGRVSKSTHIYIPPEIIFRSQEPPSTNVGPISLTTGSSTRVSSMGGGLPFRGLAGLSSSRRSLQISQLGGLPTR